MTQNLTNKEALDAMEIFEKCQHENLNFKLKYAMARNLQRLKAVQTALNQAKDVSHDENCADFLAARKDFIDSHKGQRPGEETFDMDLASLESSHVGAINYLKAKEKEVGEWLDCQVEGIEIFKIPIASFPEETTIDLGKIFAFISDE